MEKKKFQKVFFNETSNTYRSFPENYWLASVKHGKLVFDSWDKSIINFDYHNDVIKLHKERTNQKVS